MNDLPPGASSAPETVIPLGDARRVLEETFGHRDFRPGQEEVIRSLLSGRSALAVFPTGGGKSLCYQLPALLIDGLTLVISPLTALMKDQIDALLSHGVPAVRLDSSLTPEEYREVTSRIDSGDARILYVTPERFLNERFRSLILRQRIGLFAVDEAHCISEWGHNFRPDYLKLASFAREAGAERILGLTATATPTVRDDVCRAFEIDPADVTATGFHRPNLTVLLTPIAPEERETTLVERLRSRGPGAAIVYVTLQRTAEQIAAYLAKAGFTAQAYHAGLEADRRRDVQEWFMQSSDAIVVATIAFGMGIDKPDIRQVYHFNLPKSLENFSQEIGRAGRDGEPAICEALVTRVDLRALENFAYGDTPAPRAIEGVLGELFDQGDELALNLHELSTRHDTRILVLRTLLVYLELDGFLRGGTPFYAEFKFKPQMSSAEILARYSGEPQEFLRAILRHAKPGRTWLSIDTEEVARALCAERDRVVRALDHLAQGSLIELKASGTRQRYEVIRRPDDVAALAADYTERVLDRERREIERIEQFLGLVELDACQNARLGEHFGDPLDEPCGRCSWCLGEGQAARVAAEVELPIDDAVIEEARTLAAEHPGPLGETRALARFLAGLSSPAVSRAKLQRHDLFGVLDRVAFPRVLAKVEERDGGAPPDGDSL